jgi:hypothetical protein
MGQISRNKLLTGKTPGLYTPSIKIASEAERCKLLQLHLLPEPPILTGTSLIINRQGGMNEGSIGGTDEAIHSKANMTNTCAGGWCADGGEISNIIALITD